MSKPLKCTYELWFVVFGRSITYCTGGTGNQIAEYKMDKKIKL
jgi:hypothetical protein